MAKADERKVEAARLGSYEILRRLARGGMAEIFLARTVGPLGFEKLVVLKKILPKHAANPKFVQLFLDEARLAAGLDHPHIAHVHDLGTVDGNYFFTMEYVHGQDVRAILHRTDQHRRKFPIELAVQVARNVAAALHYAHERRRPDGALLDIVHRDVSPSNVIVSYDGAVKLLDFGVAKAASSSIKTRTGALKGKIAYMSPEQARGAALDRRSDIFSLGIVLWEMVTTRRLFKAENDLATIQLIVNTAPPLPSSVRVDCPPELERIVLRALAYDRDDRYQTAQEMQLDLEELARENKLNQSSVALGGYLGKMFSAEIEAWRNAQANGVTLTDHIVAEGSVGGVGGIGGIGGIGPELASADVEEDDEDDEGATGAPEPDDALPGVPGPRQPATLPGTGGAFVSAGTRASGPLASMAPARLLAPAPGFPLTTASASAASVSVPSLRPARRGPVVALAAITVTVVAVLVGIAQRDDDVVVEPTVAPAATPASAPVTPEPAVAPPPSVAPVPAPAVAPPPAEVADPVEVEPPRATAPAAEPPPPAAEPPPLAAEPPVAEPERRPARKKKPTPSRSSKPKREPPPEPTKPAPPKPPPKQPKFDPNAALPPS